jgi:hypothetical protein
MKGREGERGRERGYTTYLLDKGMGSADGTRTDTRICKQKEDLRASEDMGVGEWCPRGQVTRCM